MSRAIEQGDWRQHTREKENAGHGDKERAVKEWQAQTRLAASSPCLYSNCRTGFTGFQAETTLFPVALSLLVLFPHVGFVARLPPLRVWWCSLLLLCVSRAPALALSCVYVPPPRFFARLSPRSSSLSWLYNKEITPLGGKDRPAHTHAPCTQTPTDTYLHIQTTHTIHTTNHPQERFLPSSSRWLS